MSAIKHLLQFVGVTSKTNQPQELEQIIGFYIAKNAETGVETLAYRCPRRPKVNVETGAVETKVNVETGKEEPVVIGCGNFYSTCGTTVYCCGRNDVTLLVPVDQLSVVTFKPARRAQEGTAKVGNQRVIDTESLPGQWDGDVVYDGSHPSGKIKDYDLGNTALDSGLWGGGW